MCAGSSCRCEFNGVGDDEDDDILGMGWESTERSKRERLAAAVGLGRSLKRPAAGVCSHVKLSATRDLKQALGFLERAESESATTVRGNSRFA